MEAMSPASEQVPPRDPLAALWMPSSGVRRDAPQRPHQQEQSQSRDSRTAWPHVPHDTIDMTFFDALLDGDDIATSRVSSTQLPHSVSQSHLTEQESDAAPQSYLEEQENDAASESVHADDPDEDANDNDDDGDATADLSYLPVHASTSMLATILLMERIRRRRIFRQQLMYQTRALHRDLNVSAARGQHASRAEETIEEATLLLPQRIPLFAYDPYTLQRRPAWMWAAASDEREVERGRGREREREHEHEPRHVHSQSMELQRAAGSGREELPQPRHYTWSSFPLVGRLAQDTGAATTSSSVVPRLYDGVEYHPLSGAHEDERAASGDGNTAETIGLSEAMRHTDLDGNTRDMHTSSLESESSDALHDSDAVHSINSSSNGDRRRLLAEIHRLHNAQLAMHDSVSQASMQRRLEDLWAVYRGQRDVIRASEQQQHIHSPDVSQMR